MAKKVVVALHGFLGQPRDWDPIRNHFLSYDWYSLDYLNIPETQPADFTSWTENFKKWLDQNLSHYEEKIIMGYSLGGRLALHFVLNQPGYFHEAVFVSTGLGLKDESLKRDRVQSDLIWANDFLNLEWNQVIQKWNSQSVFQGAAIEPQRFEKDFNRKFLAQALIDWSLGKQEDLSQKLATIQIPTYWFAGEKDPKYCALLETVRKQLPNAHTQIIDQVGHRLLLESPQEIVNCLQGYLK